MPVESIYGDHYDDLVRVMDMIVSDIEDIRKEITEKNGMNPVEHCLSRIKTDESMREKCRRKNIPVCTESALKICKDAIGIRVVCPFLDDVYAFRDALVNSGKYEVIEEKDYIRNVKPSGYRSYHLIIRTHGYFAEIQLRTISQDTWASLEHHINYKKNAEGDRTLLQKELKRCADELAATDVSMQTIRNMIIGTGSRQ